MTHRHQGFACDLGLSIAQLLPCGRTLRPYSENHNDLRRWICGQGLREWAKFAAKRSRGILICSRVRRSWKSLGPVLCDRVDSEFELYGAAKVTQVDIHVHVLHSHA